MLEPRILRQGKSVSFVACDVLAEGSIATRALFAFGGARESAFQQEAAVAPIVPAPDDCPSFFGERRPAFANHFDMRLAGGCAPVSRADRGEILVWARHRDPQAPSDMTSLIAMADSLPPASITRFAEPAALSTMTWQFDLAEAARFRAVQWVLMHACDDNVRDGYSGQSMTMWDAQGQPLLAGRQSVAIFA